MKTWGLRKLWFISLILPFSGHSREHATCWEVARDGDRVPKGAGKGRKEECDQGRGVL